MHFQLEAMKLEVQNPNSTDLGGWEYSSVGEHMLTTTHKVLGSIPIMYLC